MGLYQTTRQEYFEPAGNLLKVGELCAQQCYSLAWCYWFQAITPPS